MTASLLRAFAAGDKTIDAAYRRDIDSQLPSGCA